MEIPGATATVARNMRALRRARDLTGEQLAARMRARGFGWTRVLVSKLETGLRGHVHVDELLALADVLGVDPMALTREDLTVTVETVDAA